MQHPTDIPENSRSQLIILRNTRWVVRLSILKVFGDARTHNAAVVAICLDIVDEPSPWNSKPASKATLSSVGVLHLPSSPGRTISIVPRDLFGCLRHSRCPSYVFVPDLVFACHSLCLHPVQHSILVSFTSIRFSSRFIAAHGSASPI